MNRVLLIAVLVIFISFSLAGSAVEVGVRFSVSYNPNDPATLRNVSLPLSVGLSLYGELDHDPWTGTVAVALPTGRRVLSVLLAADYAMTPRVNAKAQFSFGLSPNDVMGLFFALGAETKVSGGALDVWVGSMPLTVVSISLPNDWNTVVSVMPGLFAVADWTTPGGVRLRGRVDVIITPLIDVLIEQSLPPSRMWERVGLAISSSTSVGFALP